MDVQEPPIITNPEAFIKEQYDLLSPNWATLTGKEQFDIIRSKYQSIASGTTTVNGVLPVDTTDAAYKVFALKLSIAYIYSQSGSNPAVAECLGLEDISAMGEEAIYQ